MAMLWVMNLCDGTHSLLGPSLCPNRVRGRAPRKSRVAIKSDRPARAAPMIDLAPRLRRLAAAN
jgi:hypothetical protein